MLIIHKQVNIMSKSTQRALFTSIVLFAIVGALAATILLKKHYKETEAQVAATTEAPSIGGDFNLTDQHEQTVTLASNKGKYQLVFFGFTHCPDICPVTLTAITEAFNQMGDKSTNFVPVLITVDPERDTPAVLAEYSKAFHPSLVALTGPREEIERVSKEFGVYSAKVTPEPKEHQEASMDHGSHSDANHGGGYNVDHTGLVYLMGRDGKYLSHFSQDTSADTFAKELSAVLDYEAR